MEPDVDGREVSYGSAERQKRRISLDLKPLMGPTGFAHQSRQTLSEWLSWFPSPDHIYRRSDGTAADEPLHTLSFGGLLGDHQRCWVLNRQCC
jgi:hypothetical protein